MVFNLKEIKNEVDTLLPKIIEIRHYLHANPELSLSEFKTSEFVREQLSLLDIELFSPFLSTDVVALLNGNKAEKNVTLRADMDALPISEKNTTSYCSINEGIMHACGHDGHTAMLIGTAIILEKFKEQLNGSVRFVFQPGEEIVAAGKDLVGKGILNSPKPIAVLALHGWPGYPIGAICSKPGNLMAAADIFKIKIMGKGGHGANSDQKNNPILIASKIINRLSLIPLEEFNTSDSVVISFGKFVGGTNSNVIPNEVIIEGSTRYFGKSVGERVPDLFENVLKTECNNADVEYELKYDRPYIPTVNNSEVVEKCKNYVKEFINESAWIDIQNPVMSSEDFSYYIDENPGGMFFLGMGENSPDLHTNSYDFNDAALKNGILFFVISTIRLLSYD